MYVITPEKTKSSVFVHVVENLLTSWFDPSPHALAPQKERKKEGKRGGEGGVSGVVILNK